jgi:hypothetical protein
VFTPHQNYSFTTSNDEPDGESRKSELRERMIKYANAGDFYGAMRTFLDAPPESYDLREFMLLLHCAFAVGFVQLRAQSNAEELSLRRKYASKLRKDLKNLAAEYRAAASGTISFAEHGRTDDLLSEKLRKINVFDRTFRGWSRELYRAQRAEKVVRQIAEVKLRTRLSPKEAERWKSIHSLLTARDEFFPWPCAAAYTAERPTTGVAGPTGPVPEPSTR